MYNIITIYILVTIIVAVILGFSLYRRYTKKGLGPRILSFLYIDGLNAKSIGNILCIVALFIAIIGLFNQWYGVSANLNLPGVQTEGFTDIILIDGINGIQINMLMGDTGQLVQMGSFTFPFSLFIGISFAFFLVGTAGIHLSKKLGRKYLFRGIQICFIIILLLIVIMSLGALGNVLESMGIEGDASSVTQIFSSIASAPVGGELSIDLTIPDIDAASAQLSWGVSTGGWLILIAGIIMCIAGILEYSVKTQFYIPKEDQPQEKPSKSKQDKPKKESEKKK
jgi:hypothetical protein